MIVQLTHIDGHEMGFACQAFNIGVGGKTAAFVSPTGKDMEWDEAAMAVIAELTIHYDSGILLKKVKSSYGENRGAHSAYGHQTGRSTAGMGG